MLSDKMFNDGIELLSANLIKVFGTDAAREDIEQQKRVFNGEDDINDFLSPEQEAAQERADAFVPDLIEAKDRGNARMTTGVTMHLKGAYSCYKAGMELETVRHLVLALGALCHSIGWKKAAAYLNQQNSVLFDLSKSERESSN